MSKGRKQSKESTELTRRQMFGRVGRLVALGGIGALFARSVLGPKAPDGVVPLCTECPALSGCVREDGIATRRAMNIERGPRAGEQKRLCAERPDTEGTSRRDT
jgi:hypothetical protein